MPSSKAMWTGASPSRRRRRLWSILCGAALVFSGPGANARAEDPPALRHVSEERAELFVAMLKRRAEQLLAARQPPPPPPILAVSSGVTAGYESNVNLDGSRNGDTFTQETLGLLVRPRNLPPWLRLSLSYDLLNSHYAERRDANLWLNALGAVLGWAPHPRTRAEVAYEYTLANFPFDTASSFTDHRTTLRLLWAQTGWLTHQAAWTYQAREYDTRLARDGPGTDIAGLVREDRRQEAAYEIRLRHGGTGARLRAQAYRNMSNDQLENFYDWDDGQLRAILTQALNDRWTVLAMANYERRNYAERSVPVIAVAQRDTLWTLAAVALYQITEALQASYSLTYRYQDSNDPRLDFTDWVNQIGVTVAF